MRRLAAVTLSLAAVLASLLNAPSHAPVAAKKVRGLLTRQDKELAIRAAKHAAVEGGYSGPGWPANVDLVEAVSSTRGAANQLLDAGVDSNFRVIAIRMTGTFTWGHSAPPGAPTSTTGHVAILIMQATTGEVWDSGLGKTLPKLSSLGTVTVLYGRT